jgi:hypothetical protein
MDRAGVTSTGRGGATCRNGIGDGTGSVRTLWGSRRPAPMGRVAWVFRAGVVARALETDRLVLVGFECFACLARWAPAFDTFVGGRRRARLDCWVLVFRACFGLLDDALDNLWTLLLERRAFTPPP